MDNIHFLTGLINVTAGLIASLIGFKMLKPFNPKWEEIVNQNLLVFKYGGIGMMVWGIFKMISS